MIITAPFKEDNHFYSHQHGGRRGGPQGRREQGALKKKNVVVDVLDVILFCGNILRAF